MPDTDLGFIDMNDGNNNLLTVWTLAIVLIGLGFFLQSIEMDVQFRRAKYILPLGFLFLAYALYMSIKKLIRGKKNSKD